MGKRVIQLDIIKGLAIILVEVGHCIYAFAESSQRLAVLDQLIYIFHMPLFFSVSGYLFNPVSNIAKKARRLLVPFFVCASPVILVHIFRGEYSNNFGLNLLEECFAQLRGGYYWYLIYLFYMFAFSKICFEVATDKRKALLISMTTVLAMYLITVRLSATDFIVRFFYNYFFFLAGYMAKKKGIYTLKNDRRNWICGLSILSVVSTGLYFAGIAVFKIFAAIGIVGVIFLLLDRNDFRETNIIGRIGKYTMPIYLFDQYLIDFENKIMPDIVWLVPIFTIINVCIPIVIYELIIKKSKTLLLCFGG